MSIFSDTTDQTDKTRPRDLSESNIAIRDYSYNTLLVNRQTSHTKAGLIKAFQEYGTKYGVDTFGVCELIDNHNRYLKVGSFYFPFNSRLPFLQKYRSTQKQRIKLEEFIKSFGELGSVYLPGCISRVWTWTITRKLLKLDNPQISRKIKGDSEKVSIKYPEIEKAEDNLRALFTRLERYGYIIEKYLLVPEIKDSEEGYFNYHYHVIIQATADLDKISKCPYKELTSGRIDGYVDNPSLSAIWKEITKDGSYRIKPEVVKSKDGMFSYLLSYLNKPLSFKNPEHVPQMYYALKNSRSFRVKGKTKKFPDVKYEFMDLEGQKIEFKPKKEVSLIDFEKIPIDYQIYRVNIYRNGIFYSGGIVVDRFKNKKPVVMNQQHLIQNYQQEKNQNDDDFEKILGIVERFSCVPYNIDEIDREIKYNKIDVRLVQKLIEQGQIYESRFGHLEILK